MICKYCGAWYTGNKCTSCGKVIPLVKRSTDLEILMSGTSHPSETNNPPVKTYEQGLMEGYQKGLKEGFNNGYAEGKGNSVPSTVPDKRTAKMSFRTLIVFASIVLLLAAATGLIFNRIGYKNGYRQGMDLGIQKGTEEGSLTARENLESKLDEKYQEGYKLGYDTAKSEISNVEQPAVYMLDFPYSQVRNKGSENPVVEKIQKRLKDLGYKVRGKDIKVDGIYGPDTEKTVRIFQYKTGLTATGEVDLETYGHLFPEEYKTEKDQSDEQEATVTSGDVKNGEQAKKNITLLPGTQDDNDFLSVPISTTIKWKTFPADLMPPVARKE